MNNKEFKVTMRTCGYILPKKYKFMGDSRMFHSQTKQNDLFVLDISEDKSSVWVLYDANLLLF